MRTIDQLIDADPLTVLEPGEMRMLQAEIIRLRERNESLTMDAEPSDYLDLVDKAVHVANRVGPSGQQKFKEILKFLIDTKPKDKL